MTEITEIDIREIKPFVSRARPRGPFERMKESIRKDGVIIPIQVRKIRDPQFKYERIVGEGRILAHREIRRWMIPAFVLEADSHAVVGRFLAENVLRKKLPWQDKARLIKFEIEDRTVTKALLADIAERYSITTGHVSKLLRILQQSSPKIRDTFDKLTVEEAEHLTSLPAPGQEIVIETLKEERLDRTQLAAVVSKARELRQDAELTKTALKQSLRRLGEDLSRQRDVLKLKRLHHQLGPGNIEVQLSDPQFRKALDRRGINYRKFEDAVKSR